MATAKDIPSSILVVGSGVFGLSTAYNLTQRPEFQETKITLLERLDFPAHDGASIDSSRIVRPDYPIAPYSKFASDAQKSWRGDFGADDRYTEAGLCILLDDDDANNGRSYMENSLKNVQEKLCLKVGRRADGGQLTVLHDENDVKEVLGSMVGDAGKLGYVNWTSGWAHAENAIRHLRAKVDKTGRVEFRTAEIKHLLFKDNNSVTGAELLSGEQIKADLTILATGAWTPTYIDVRGRATASGQILAYIDLTQEEQDELGKNPTVLNESSGCYIIQPRNRVLKVARHGYGYANPITIPHPEYPESGEKITVSLPRTKADNPNLNIPPEGMKTCRDFLARCYPRLADRPWTQTRICWYCDTPTSDFLIDYHPKYKGLFLATGGSGHGYKFLPTLGERIVDIMVGKERDELGSEFRKMWKWPEERLDADYFWTDDWRGGKKGMILDEQLPKS